MRPVVFDIKRYALNDGPGIRTTIFFSGCPLRCVWCHNPESWDAHPHKMYKQKKCIGCLSCVDACPEGAITLTADGIRPVEGVKCLRYGRCASECPTLALEMCGREWSMEELMAEIEKERDIMTDSGGGVTLCGGEPLFQPEATIAVLDELGRRGFHRTVDTTLFADPEIVREVAKRCELLLVDMKIMDPDLHRRYTGVSNERILDNLRLIAELGTPYYVRIPLIEGINADESNIEATTAFLDSLPNHKGLCGVNLLPYHDVGRDKHRRLWSIYNPDGLTMSAPSDETMQRCAEQFKKHGYNV
ncbi:MAG: glycyl-radical enzyme activating protein [Prevotella sp.]|nr:glycyl-radical enzyme activating protein [Prevotella sp.]